MPKYHVNPESGNVNPCRASVKSCAFAVNGELPEHYDTKTEAQQAAEKIFEKIHGTFSNNLVKKETKERPKSLAERRYEALQIYNKNLEKYERMQAKAKSRADRMSELSKKREEGIITYDEDSELSEMEYEDSHDGYPYYFEKPSFPYILSDDYKEEKLQDPPYIAKRRRYYSYKASYAKNTELLAKYQKLREFLNDKNSDDYPRESEAIEDLYEQNGELLGAYDNEDYDTVEYYLYDPPMPQFLKDEEKNPELKEQREKALEEYNTVVDKYYEQVKLYDDIWTEERKIEDQLAELEDFDSRVPELKARKEELNRKAEANGGYVDSTYIPKPVVPEVLR